MYSQLIELLKNHPRTVFTEAQLAAHFGVSRLEVRRAIRQLPTGCIREPSGVDKVRVSFARELEAVSK